jgi:hypothetical protein
LFQLTAAFKEWAIVVDALARGEQIFILRKGGIHEGRGGFRMEHDRFVLFPTLFQQQRESVIPSAQERFDQISPHFAPAGILRVEYWAEVVEHRALDRFENVQALAGQHIWREEILAERFEWGREQSIYAIVVRVHRLPTKVEMPMLAEYGGCKSWVTLAHAGPLMPDPVLDDDVFAERLRFFQAALKR